MTIRALVADDSEDARALIKASLLGFGDFEIVGEASNGAEAVELAGELEPDVVILDLAMPIMDGMTALPEIRRRSPGSRIVVFSAFSGEELRRDASRLGADAYSIKGIDPRALVALVEKSVAGARGRVLLVESPAGGQGYRVALEQADFRVVAVASIADALQQARARNFDIVLVDLWLVGGDGLQDLLSSRDRGSHAEVPVVVMLSGREDPGLIDRAFRLGAAACMSRDAVPPTELPARVDLWIEQGANFRSV